MPYDTHNLKIRPEYFEAILTHKKNFEIRKDDRDYKVRDDVILHEYENEKYTGRAITKRIEYILRDCPEYGLMPGYCILGF